MYEGHSRDEWTRWSNLLALIAETNRDTKKRRTPYSADEFNPHVTARRPRGMPLTKQVLHAMKGMFK
jgi:hypothetical protein